MIKSLITIITICSLQISAQENFEFDYAQFKNDSSTNVLEIYYSIFSQNNSPSEYKNDKLIMHIQLENMVDNELIINKDWVLSNKDAVDKKDLNLLGIVEFVVSEGEYKFYISFQNESNNSKILKEFSEIINVKPFHCNKPSISEIELASRIVSENSNKNSIFYKNTLEVIPNPSSVFPQNSPVLFFYAELYNLNFNNSRELNFTQTIFNSNNISVYEKKKIINNQNNSIVEIGAVNLKKYPTGSYKLVLSLEDSISGEPVISSKKFYIINPIIVSDLSSARTNNSYVSSEFGVLSEDECDDLFKKSKIIAFSDEIDNYNLLDSLNQKREFLYKFWRKRDDTPSTSVNEFKNNYFNRIKLANTRFGTMFKKGYNTDRGRIYLRLGEPDEIDRHPNETDTKPYEIWSYHSIEGGVYFIFGDITGYNYYQLLHSTMRGELQDPHWKRRISSR